MIIKGKENHFTQNSKVYNFSDFSQENRFFKESRSKNVSDDRQPKASISPNDKLCQSSSFHIFDPDQYILEQEKQDFAKNLKETKKSATISKLKHKFVKLKGSPERNVSDKIDCQTELCSRRLMQADEKSLLKRSIITNCFQDNGDPKRTALMYESADKALPRNCSEHDAFLNEADRTELKELCFKKDRTKYSVLGTVMSTGMHANCNLFSDASYSTENDTFHRKNKYFKEMYVNEDEVEASDEEIYETANTCVRCNNPEIDYPTANNPHEFLKHHSIQLRRNKCVPNSSSKTGNYPRFYSSNFKCQLEFQRASDESSDFPGDSRIHGMPTTSSSDREIVDLNNFGQETLSTCSSSQDRTSVIYRRKKWSVEEGTNRNYIRALAHRNAETRTDDIQQPDRPLWTVHYDNVNYIRSFMSPHVVGNAFLVL